jgi:hypothetical protein
MENRESEREAGCKRERKEGQGRGGVFFFFLHFLFSVEISLSVWKKLFSLPLPLPKCDVTTAADPPPPPDTILKVQNRAGKRYRLKKEKTVNKLSLPSFSLQRTQHRQRTMKPKSTRDTAETGTGSARVQFKGRW